MTDGMFCVKCLSQYQEILSKTRLFGAGKYSKLGRTLVSFWRSQRHLIVILHVSFYTVLSYLCLVLHAFYYNGS